MNKISIIGAGRVGESTAQFIAEKNLCRELMLIDIREGVPQGVALDIQETAPLLGFDTQVNGCHNPEGIKNSDLIVVTAGIPRQPGMSRSDVLDTNVKIMDQIAQDIKKYSPDAIIIIVSNPVDSMTYRVFQQTGFSRSQVFGQAGVLDSTRMASFIAMETGLSVKDIHAMVLGGHGDTMVPMIRFTTISGIPVEHYMDKETIQEIIERTRFGGAEILGLRKTSSAYDAPAASITAMVEAIVHNRKRVLPCVAILDGEYGETNVAMGVPCVLGAKGLERIIELPLNNEEQRMFASSLNSIKSDLKKLPNQL